MTAILREDPPDLARDQRLVAGGDRARYPSLPGEAARRTLPVGARSRVCAAGAIGHDHDEWRERARDGRGSRDNHRHPPDPSAADRGRARARRRGVLRRPHARARRVNRPSLPLTFQQLTDDAGVETDPAISPDGASVAFTRRAGGKADIYVQRIGGRNAILVAGDPARVEAAPAFSPDGASIAFHEGGGKGGIFVAGATGESTRRVTDFGFHPAWSPDGQRIVFCTEEIASPAGRSSTSALWVVDAKSGSPPTKLTDGDAVEPAWSPSGARIAYWAVDAGQRDLYTMPAGGGPAHGRDPRRGPGLGPALVRRWPGSVLLERPRRLDEYLAHRGRRVHRRARRRTRTRHRGRDQRRAGRACPPTDRGVVFRSAAVATNPIAIPFDPVAERAGPPTQLLDRTGVLMPDDHLARWCSGSCW